jgi:rhodanese-related sulfurtransferase
MFVLVDLFGILVWIATFELLGFVFSAQLEKIAAYAFRASTLLFAFLAAGVLVAHIVRKYVRRRSFLQALRIARITAPELKQKLDKNEPVTIIDLRHSLDFLPDPYTIPGAIRIPLEELETRQGEIPRDREVVLYCTCPNEATSAITAVKLQQVGISPVRPLQGGFHAWRQFGFPVESAFDAVVDQVLPLQCESPDGNPNTPDEQGLLCSVTPPA